MYIRPILLTILYLLPSFCAMSQEQWISWEAFCEEFSAHVEEEGTIDDDWQIRLEEMAMTPANINLVTREQLLLLPFLSEEQADSIIAYRTRKKELTSLGELMFIRNLSYTERRYLSLFTYAAPRPDSLAINRDLFLAKGKHQVNALLGIPLYKRAGNRTYTLEELQKNRNLVYLGNGLATTVRYRYDFRQVLRYGLTLEKDAGEPFGQKNNYPFDHTSFYFHFRPAHRRFEWLAGDFRLRWGQGLLFGDAFLSAPALLLDAPRRTKASFSPHSSTEESTYFRGAAATWNFRQWKLTALASYRQLDARTEGDTIRSLITTGLHRTETEINRRRAVSCFTIGTHVAFEQATWSIGTGAYWTYYNKPFAPEPRLYNRYYLHGQSAAGISVDWHIRFGKRWILDGETAADRRFHLAMTQTLSWNAADDLRFTLQQRHYSPRFVAPHAKSFQANSRTANEHGAMLGAKFSGLRRAELRAYIDYFRFPAPTYISNRASDGVEVLGEVKYFPTKVMSLLLRYKTRSRQRNITGYDGYLEYTTTHRMRLQAQWKTVHTILSGALDGCIAKRQTQSATHGWMASLRAAHQFGNHFTLRAFAALFNTDDYQSALYAYEPQLPQTFLFPASFYHGWRTSAVMQWKTGKHFHIALRYAMVHYFNRSVISSGTQEIASPTQQDIAIYAAWLF